MNDQPKTLYVVHSGEYSDYKFHGIFSSREKIAEIPKLRDYDSLEIKEVEVDSLWSPDGIYSFYVIIGILDPDDVFVHIRLGSKDNVRKDQIHRYYKDPYIHSGVFYRFSTRVNADSEEKAVKIANERRRKYAAMGVDELAALTKEQSVVEIDHETGKDS